MSLIKGRLYSNSKEVAVLLLLGTDNDGDYIFKVLQDYGDEYFCFEGGIMSLFKEEAESTLNPLKNDYWIQMAFKSKESKV